MRIEILFIAAHFAHFAISKTRMATWEKVPGLEYHSAFLNAEEQRALEEAIAARPLKWKTLLDRRVQNWGGLPHARGMIPVDLPDFLQVLARRLVAANIYESAHIPNHVLINQYQPGQGIAPHTDGPVYMPTAAIISLQSATLFNIHAQGEKVASVWLQPGSLLVLKGASYNIMHHGIEARRKDTISHRDILNKEHAPSDGSIIERTERTSLTLRRASKTIRNPLRLSKRSVR